MVLLHGEEDHSEERMSKKTHSSCLSINIAIHVQMSRHICRHFHSFSIQVPERTTLGLGSKEMTLTPKMQGST